jgi:hypothetical protein
VFLQCTSKFHIPAFLLLAVSESSVARTVGVGNTFCFRPKDKSLTVVTMHTKHERIDSTQGSYCRNIEGCCPLGRDTVSIGRWVPTYEGTCCVHLQGRTYTENGGSRSLEDFGTCIPNYTASHPSRE